MVQSTIWGSVPATAERTSTIAPAMWWVGRARIHLPGPDSAASVALAEATRASVEMPTRRGLPALEPEVGMTRSMPSKNPGSSTCAAMSGYSSAGNASEGASAAARRVEGGTWSGSRRTTMVRGAGWEGSAWRSSWSSTSLCRDAFARAAAPALVPPGTTSTRGVAIVNLPNES